jgi:putative colanic acid biosynthesis acetyltransferase WcaF
MDTINLGSRVRLKDFNSAIGLNRGGSKMKYVFWYIVKVIFFLSAFPYPSSLKVFLLKKFGAKLGTGVIIKPRVNFHFPWNLEIGNNVWIGEEVFILNFEKISIGDNVCVSQRAFLCGGNHDFRNPSMPYFNEPITLYNGCWIGACCFIGPGVSIGVDTVIAAGSIVTTDVKDNLVCRRNPPEFSRERWK